MTSDLEKVKTFAKDLTKNFPRSPRETLGGYVLAARCIDKCRATISGINGEYNFACPVDTQFLSFAEINPEELKSYVATGATDEEIGEWITQHARKRERKEIILWNNKKRDQSLSDLTPELQEYMEDYVKQVIPKGRVIYRFFDIYDIEEKRM